MYVRQIYEFGNIVAVSIPFEEKEEGVQKEIGIFLGKNPKQSHFFLTPSIQFKQTQFLNSELSNVAFQKFFRR